MERDKTAAETTPTGGEGGSKPDPDHHAHRTELDTTSSAEVTALAAVYSIWLAGTWGGNSKERIANIKEVE